MKYVAGLIAWLLVTTAHGQEFFENGRLSGVEVKDTRLLVSVAFEVETTFGHPPVKPEVKHFYLKGIKFKKENSRKLVEWARAKLKERGLYVTYTLPPGWKAPMPIAASIEFTDSYTFPGTYASKGVVRDLTTAIINQGLAERGK